ncbi:hypothetical protein FHS29_006593 [Saccharothrix tamanrassetensis]|uniref:Uncharacterized protein n=1 Tax=Saccharothrix tamanrassetensis TaxID=1051531 RepID=A0A841CQH4_9PSEU|nr:hypothetical protein [Saccharothrix tamanrassetensis]MBB5959971.1 hypothetical protein [Saccharothrix tamanrassetensis]
MRTEQSDGQPNNRRARRSGGVSQPRFGGGRVVVNPRQYAMRRR